MAEFRVGSEEVVVNVRPPGHNSKDDHMFTVTIWNGKRNVAVLFHKNNKYRIRIKGRFAKIYQAFLTGNRPDDHAIIGVEVQEV